MAVALPLTVALSTGTTLPAGAAVLSTGPGLGLLLISQPLPGYTMAPAGPTNGPLTPAEFASQSTSPGQAEAQFNALAAEPGFGAFIRLWTDRTGAGQGANDVAVLLFRIPVRHEAESFAAGLRAPFAGSHRLDVPSIPGAHGYTVDIASPVRAVEQIVVFRAGQYVTMTELASSASASNPAALTPSQAVSVSYQQYGSIRHGDPVRSTDVRRRATRPAPATTSSASAAALVAAVIAFVALAALAVWAFAFRPLRRRRLTAAVPGPWDQGGLFDVFGATVPDQSHRSDPARHVPEIATGPWSVAKMDPMLVAAPPPESATVGAQLPGDSPWAAFDDSNVAPSGGERN
jgi:hypothetical protein